MGVRQKKPVDPKIIEGLKEGLTLEEIAVANECSYQWVQQCALRVPDIYSEWKEKRDKNPRYPRRPSTHEQKRNLVSLMKSRIAQLAVNKPWPIKTAAEYIAKKYRMAFDFDVLVTFFERYEHAKQTGERTTLDDLRKDLPIKYKSNATLILKQAGLKPLHTHKYRENRKNPEEKNALERSKDLQLSLTDIGYFLNIPSHVVKYWRKKRNIENKFDLAGRTRCAPPQNAGIPLSFKKASEIYEAHDIGFKDEEISELFDSRPELVAHALEFRSQIEPKLIEKLKILYNDDSIDKPYKRSLSKA